MIPRPIENLICPGRAVSVEGQVLGPVRVMAPCMAMGEASGTAAGQVINNKIPFNQVDLVKLRQKLKDVGAIIDSEDLPDIQPRVDQV